MRPTLPPGRATRLGCWLKLIRLQFYPMAILAFALGALAGVRTGGLFRPVLFVLGMFTLFCIEMATVLTNELHDQDTDRLNQNRSPFSGGSGMIVSGRLKPDGVRWAIKIVLILVAALAAATVVHPAAPDGWTVICYLAVGVVLGLGYTVPPVRLSARGLGELTVGVTHSLYVLLYGFYLMTGRLMHTVPLLLAAPIFFSVASAIILSGLPDLESDRTVGKKTLAERLGPDRAAWLAASCTLLSIVSIVPLYVFDVLSFAASACFVLLSGCHGLVLTFAIRRVIKQEAFDTRIDGTMQLALSHILWTVLVPLAGLLWP